MSANEFPELNREEAEIFFKKVAGKRIRHKNWPVGDFIRPVRLTDDGRFIVGLLENNARGKAFVDMGLGDWVFVDHEDIDERPVMIERGVDEIIETPKAQAVVSCRYCNGTGKEVVSAPTETKDDVIRDLISDGHLTGAELELYKRRLMKAMDREK